MKIIIRHGVPWKEVYRPDGSFWYETTTPAEDAVEIERLRDALWKAGKLSADISNITEDK